MMRFRLLTLVLAVVLCVPMLAQTTNIDPASVKVEELSDGQIKKLIQEMNGRGLTESEAIALARARGMSQSQISKLRQRINEVKLGGVSTSTNTITSQSDGSMPDGVISKKKAISEEVVDRRIFGFSFFNNENLSFEPNINIPIPDSYVLGAGDEILIDIWGVSQQSYQLLVDKNGSVNIPNAGPVRVGGVTQEVAKQRLFNKLALIYRDLKAEIPKTFANISVGAVKSIKVNVIGEVFLPGTYTLPGTATAFNALYLSGGPNKNGSYRNIQVIRSGELAATLDVYEYLLKGKSTINIPLRDGDVVLIPTYEKRIKMAGEFKRTGLFEAKEEEVVGDLINYAGGFTENAYKDRIELYRTTSRQRQFKDVLRSEFNDVLARSGDSIFAGVVLDRFDNKVSIQGAVYRPGDYQLYDDMTLIQLIDRADGLIENAFLNRGIIKRLKPNYTSENISFSVSDIIEGKENYKLQANDEVFIQSIDDMREEQFVAIWGEVQAIGSYVFSENLTLGDLVLMAGGFKESASATSIEVMRRLPYSAAENSTEVSSELFNFDIKRDLTLEDEGANFVLKPFDEVFVRYMPGFRKSSVVKISGEVKHSGDYGLSSRTETISQLIKRAGGVTSSAYLKGAKLIRSYQLTDEEKAEREELMRKDSTLRFSELNFETVSISLETILANPGCKEDIYMEHGDELLIPSYVQTVKVSGEVLNPASTVFVKNLRVKDYINNNGGFSVSARKRKTYVMYPNGSASATKGFLFFKRYPKVAPGSEIVVPKKIEREPIPATAWIAMGSALASMSLAIVTIVDKL